MKAASTMIRTEREQALRLLHRWHRRAVALLELAEDPATRELLEWMAEDVETLGIELTPPVTVSSIRCDV
jgi:hypothetical protein